MLNVRLRAAVIWVAGLYVVIAILLSLQPNAGGIHTAGRIGLGIAVLAMASLLMVQALNLRGSGRSVKTETKAKRIVLLVETALWLGLLLLARASSDWSATAQGVLQVFSACLFAIICVSMSDILTPKS